MLIRSEPVRVFQLVLGAVLALASPIIAIPLPPPFGILILAFGLALVLRNSRWARRRYVRYTRRYSRVQKVVNYGLRRKSKRRIEAVASDAPDGGQALR